MKNQFGRRLYSRAEWQTKFSYICQLTRDNKLRQFSFRLLHRILTTKKELFKYRIASDETCIFCPISDSIEHAFIECTVTTSFYSEAFLWFNRVNNTDIGLSSKQRAFNDITDLKQLTDYQRRRLHLLVILLNQFTPANVLETTRLKMNIRVDGLIAVAN